VSNSLATIKTLFRAGLAADLDRLTRLWADEPTSPEFHGLIHDIAGAAGVFGFTDLSAIAQDINDGHSLGNRPDAVQMEQLFKRLNEAAEG
jgi:HPt (histidine-containing phosphotransfer) domain-containing protein